jgi:hypothetical protein
MCSSISTTMWEHPTGMASAMSVYSIFLMSSEYTRTENEMGTRTGAESSNLTPRTSFETLRAGSMSFRKLASYMARLTLQLFTSEAALLRHAPTAKTASVFFFFFLINHHITKNLIFVLYTFYLYSPSLNFILDYFLGTSHCL